MEAAVEYSDLIQRIAYTLDPISETRIDTRAKNRQDYEIQLATKAWQVKGKFRERNAAAPKSEETRFVAKSLWRKVRSYHAARRVRNSLSYMFVAPDDIPANETFNAAEGRAAVEENLEARDILRRLRAQLTEEEWELALRVADAWVPDQRLGLATEVFDPERDATARTLQRAVARLRKKAQKIFPDLVSLPE